MECRDGRRYRCEYAVVTCPLGVLKSGMVSFRPSLSADKQEAIRGFGMGTENKIVVRFDRDFWSAHCKEMYFYCLGDPRFIFLNLSLRSIGKKGVLVVHVPPPFSYDIEEMTDEACVREVVGALASIFSWEEVKKARILDVMVTRWASDPFSKGSYSYVPVQGNVQMAGELARPEWQGRLQFAGEAGSVAGHQCVHGAMEMGCKAAIDIMTRQTHKEREREDGEEEGKERRGKGQRGRRERPDEDGRKEK